MEHQWAAGQLQADWHTCITGLLKTIRDKKIFEEAMAPQMFDFYKIINPHIEKLKNTDMS